MGGGGGVNTRLPNDLDSTGCAGPWEGPDASSAGEPAHAADVTSRGRRSAMERTVMVVSLSFDFRRSKFGAVQRSIPGVR
jgi:hypothetical protein